MKILGMVVNAVLWSALITISSTSWAQRTDIEGSLVLDELIVTAQKREESVQEVPVSVIAFSGKELNALGITQTEELGTFVPGLEIHGSAGANSQLVVFLRGAGLSDFNANNAGPIGIYSDETYVSSPALTPFQLFDAERVEILKGPQGTIYGRNTTGGAIKFITKKPTRNTKFNAKMGVSNFNTTDFEGSASGALSDSLSARIAFAKNDSDGYGTNILDGSDIYGSDSLAYRSLILYEPNENLKVLFNIHGAKVDSQATSLPALGTINPTTGQRCDAAMIRANQCVNNSGYRGQDNPFENGFDAVANIDLDSSGGYVQLDYLFGDSTFSSVTAFDEVDRLLPVESDGAPGRFLEAGFGVSSESFSQEFKLTGASDRFDWLAGAFYLNEDIDQDTSVDLFRELRQLTGGLAEPTGALIGAPIVFGRQFNQQTLESVALYSQVNFNLAEDLSLTLGGRYTDEKRGFDIALQFEEPETFGPTPLSVFNFSDLETSSDAFSYRIALDYKPSELALIYASVSRGFKSGGFNGGLLSLDPQLASRQAQAYDPEFVDAYEIGVKSDFLGSRLRVNAALFLNEFEDLQVFSLVSGGALPVIVLDNASDARASGLEIDAKMLLSPGLTLTLAAAFTDSELKNFTSASTGQNFNGNKIANTPESSFSGVLNYELGLASGATNTALGAFAYKDDVFFTTENTPGAVQEAFTIFNARLGYRSSNRVWSISAFVNNLTDEIYDTNITDVTDVTGSFSRTLGPPRSYGVELEVDF